MHKHFRMIAVSEFLKSQGYAEHTRIPGIWKKLNTLYNLPGLDERDDSVLDVEDADSATEERYCPFELPEEYGEMMFARRLATEASESPVASRAESRGSNVADTDGNRPPAPFCSISWLLRILTKTEARSSPAPSRGRKATRGRPGRSTRTTRQADAEEEDEGSDEDAGGHDEPEAEPEPEPDPEEETSDVAKEDSDAEEEAEEDTTGPRSTRAKTSRSKQKDKGGTGGARRTRRR